MRCFEIYEFINEICPFDLAQEWDNSGLTVGGNNDVNAVYIALDATDQVIASCADNGCELLLTHHPLIFTGLLNVSEQDFVGRRVLELARREISYIAAHTNYDVARMGELAAGMIGLTDCSPLLPTNESGDAGIGCIGTFTETPDLRAAAEKVKSEFGAQGIHVFGEKTKKITRAAILPGSGRSGIDQAVESGADLLITGDIDHHHGLDAVARGLAVIDAGHYGLEHIFIDDMAAQLKNRFPELRVVEDVPREPFYSL